ncbi:Protease inhibitor I8, cysteine-rich trypsin inhibitor-like protein [Akanthomyces lecanii RCEF 1005]|uniref:Protease inhibitor I8, cysteine-rich trypsin inhibitor-like protein n=1 Tax=Akanthomyces lecanii RCEF 1005 TaxID=1081108 RepID=A0A168K2F0_CORDF|nr:Protease inhibitor I8, cysteine-rich trypsin inhibitor-like protein [Akanthomyces lecanii RCEF 1005]
MKTFVPLAVVLFTLGVWSQACGPSEVRQDCGPICESCKDSKCDAIRCGGGCWCKSGYLRDGTGVCIPPDQCSPDLDEPTLHEARENPGPGSCWGTSCGEY